MTPEGFSLLGDCRQWVGIEKWRFGCEPGEGALGIGAPDSFPASFHCGANLGHPKRHFWIPDQPVSERTNDMVKKFMVVESESPDIAAAKTLSAYVAEFIAGAEARNTITPADRSAMDRIRSAKRALLEARDTLHVDWDIAARETAKIIAADVDKLLELTEGKAEIVVAGETIASPAIESAAIRHHIRRYGEGIVKQLADYVTERSEIVDRRAIERQAEDDTLRAARQAPLIGPAIRIFEELYEGMEAHPDTPSWRHAINEMPQLLQELLHVPPVESILGRDLYAAQLIETLRRQLTDAPKAVA